MNNFVSGFNIQNAWLWPILLILCSFWNV
jgi:hypothetical protein